MSDMMRPGAPPMGGPPQGGGVQSKMSVFNPTDMAAKVSKGDIRPDQTVAEFMQRNFGVSPQDPVQKLMQNLKGQAQNATMAGKMGMPQGRPQPSPAGQMGAPAGPPPSQPGGLDSLINKL
jgi:hypothetical protein